MITITRPSQFDIIAPGKQVSDFAKLSAELTSSAAVRNDMAVLLHISSRMTGSSRIKVRR
jgi:hypothetical protein